MTKNKIAFQSICVKEGEDTKSTKPHQLPIYATSSFEFETIDQGIDIFKGEIEGHVYSRYGNPTIETVANKIAQLESYGTDLNTFGVMTSSGMSAISCLLSSLCSAGDKILTQRDLYGGTTELFVKIFGRLGIETIFSDFHDEDRIEQIIEEHSGIKVIYLETPSNPTMACIDISLISDIGKKHGIITVIDNTFCTPYIQQPLKHGIDFVIHSTTKYLNGHGNSIAGVIIGKEGPYKNDVWTNMKLSGTNCNPWDAWLVNNGLKTLAVRMDRHCENALALATFLENHKKIKKVNYNGLPSHPFHKVASRQMKQYGGMLSFEIGGSFQDTIDFMNKLNFCTLAPTLGDVDTLILHPASSSHLNIAKEIREKAGISDSLIRVSVGIEDIHDIIFDINQALN